MTGSVITIPERSTFFGHPRGLATLFFTEVWERFSYYGMRALLIVFMTTSVSAGGLGFAVPRAAAIYGTYTSMAYLMSLPGGWIADRVLGLRRAVLVGGVIIMVGHVCLTVPGLPFFYSGLALIVTGTGLLKPNVSAMVGALYDDEARRDAGYSIYYMGVNLGGFVAPLATGYLAQSVGFRQVLVQVGIAPESAWHWGFGMAAVGMLLGLVQYLRGARWLGDVGRAPVRSPTQTRGRPMKSMIVVLSLVAAVTVGWQARLSITPELVADLFGVVLVGSAVGVFLWLFLANRWTAAERKGLALVALFFVAAMLFWAGSEQAGSTLNLFAQGQTRAEVAGMSFPTTWLQSVNSLFIIALAPVFAWLWVRLGARSPGSVVKLSLGLFFLAAGFVVMSAAGLAAAGGARVSPFWLVLTYFLHTIGELCLSPVGLSAVSGLAPKRVLGLIMGIWFLATSIGNYGAGRIAALYEVVPLPLLFGGCAMVALLGALGLYVTGRRMADEGHGRSM
ncbi:MAG: peptide MFS transporter [Gemmatimonadota bacterium]